MAHAAYFARKRPLLAMNTIESTSNGERLACSNAVTCAILSPPMPDTSTWAKIGVPSAPKGERGDRD